MADLISNILVAMPPFMKDLVKLMEEYVFEEVLYYIYVELMGFQ